MGVFSPEHAKVDLARAWEAWDKKGRADLAFRMMLPYAGEIARSKFEASERENFDLAVVAGAIRICAVVANVLMGSRFSRSWIVDRATFLQAYALQESWFSGYAARLVAYPYTIHARPGEPNIDWLWEWRLNDRLATALREVSLQPAAIAEARLSLRLKGRDYWPGGTPLSDLEKEDAPQASAAGVALARIWRMAHRADLQARAVELIRWANSESGPLPNPDRVAAVMGTFEPRPRNLLKALGIEVQAMLFWVRGDWLY